MQNRICLVVDGGNYFFAQKNFLGWMADPGKLKAYVEQWGEVVQAVYYLTISSYDPDNRQERFRKALYHMGYSVVAIPIKTIQTDEGTKEKADADVRIALDVFMALDTFDTFVLVSGDSDFVYLLEQLKHRGKLIRVISTKGIVAGEILECVGSGFCDLADLKKEVMKNGERV